MIYVHVTRIRNNVETCVRCTYKAIVGALSKTILDPGDETVQHVPELETEDDPELPGAPLAWLERLEW